MGRAWSLCVMAAVYGGWEEKWILRTVEEERIYIDDVLIEYEANLDLGTEQR